MVSKSVIAALLLAGANAQSTHVNLKPAWVDPVITPGREKPQMPKVGFGTWTIPNSPEGVAAVARAIKMGYRHLDGATAYQNQQTVGEGIKLALKEDPTIRREDLWVTTKYAFA
jgi:diketogulonate reductase-like aldo/keto reductase